MQDKGLVIAIARLVRNPGFALLFSRGALFAIFLLYCIFIETSIDKTEILKKNRIKTK